MVGPHEGSSPCSYPRKSLHEGTGGNRDLRREDIVAGTCSKNPNQFEIVGLVAGTKVRSLRLNFEAEMASSCNGPGHVPTTCVRD